MGNIVKSLFTANAAGLDVGSYNVKAAKLRVNRVTGERILNFGVSKINSSEQLGEAIVNASEQAIVKSESVNVTLSVPNIVLRYITMPYMSSASLSKALDFELEKYLPYKIEDMLIQHCVLSQLANKQSIVLLAAIEKKVVEKYLGVPKFRMKAAERQPRIGSVTGLAWTSVGGDILNVDVTIMRGTERLTLTGQLGEVMKESAQAALSYIRSNPKKFGIDPEFSKGREIHIHLPEGAIPKDGPSAGITMAMAIISAASNLPARNDIAMTGEITLRGNVLPIGGLNEKLLAAQRSGITTVLIPKDNSKDLTEIPEKVKEGLLIVPIETIEEAMEYVFTSIKSKVRSKK